MFMPGRSSATVEAWDLVVEPAALFFARMVFAFNQRGQGKERFRTAGRCL
jgi:hypothetical protein